LTKSPIGGNGAVIDLGTGFPRYTGLFRKSTAMIADILRANGWH
jgi:hypothetical protein